MTKNETKEDILIQYELLKTSIGLIKALTEESTIDEKIKIYLDETKDSEDSYEHPYCAVWLSKCNADEHLENLNKRIDQLNELVPNIQDEHGKRMDERYA